MTVRQQPSQYLINDSGQRTAAVVDIDYWEALMDLLEDLEDVALVKDLVARLERGPEASGALRWADVRDEV